MIKLYRKHLFVPDCHFPYHDPKAISILLQICEDFRPDVVVVLGDFWDVYGLSSHQKNRAKEPRDLEDELIEGREALRAIESKSRAKQMVVHLGNHEHRINRFIASQCGPLYSKLTPKKILEIPSHYRVIPYGYNYHYDMGPIISVHGTLTSKHHAHAMLQKYKTSVIYGHTHMLQRFYQSGLKTEIEAISSGWLGDAKRVASDYIQDTDSWQQGLTLGHIKKTKYHLDTVSIKDGEAIWGGKFYRGKA